MGVDPLAWKNDKIGEVIVEAIAILVMHHLAGQQWPAQGLLRQVAVSQHLLARCWVADMCVHLAPLDGLSSSI